MSVQRPHPELGNRVRDLIERTDTSSDDTVEILVGLDEDVEDGVLRLEELVERVNGTIKKDLGFAIFKLEVTVDAVEELSGAGILEYIEYPDPDEAPNLMGN